MKLVWVAIGLLVAGIGVGVACGPKESFCYAEGKTCEEVKREMLKKDAEWMAEVMDAAQYTCFDGGVAFMSPDPCK